MLRHSVPFGIKLYGITGRSICAMPLDRVLEGQIEALIKIFLGSSLLAGRNPYDKRRLSELSGLPETCEGVSEDEKRNFILPDRLQST
ncbi:unnamed protein product [Allacma fusca]|uniref:Uncharacterized protein n=1 Tax=Allacma fusca TaxID=39272 RepID=A0A8J2NJ83_9HEXA|nr:unnamed protein product [Allacma fusca]